jgi:ketosteroid isomerase-like protein
MRTFALFLLAAPVESQEAPRLEPKALQEMVQTEREFAAMGAEKGVHESFFKYFGEEGISFSPHPGKFREGARANPPPDPPPPRQFKLEWWPVYGDVSESGDLGYNTGPTLVTDVTPQNRPARHGYFFSVWKKQVDGTWTVAVDMGVGTPSADPAWQDRLRYVRAPQEESKGVAPRGSGRDEMMKLEAEFSKSTRESASAGYARYTAGIVRLHRPGAFPMLGRAAVAKFVESSKLGVVEWEGIDGSVAASGDLGYTYGRYGIQVSGASEKGYFTHVWKRDGNGAWKLVAEVMSPVPAEAR